MSCSSFELSGTAVTALWLKMRFFLRIIFMRDLQCGSGQLGGLFALCRKTSSIDVYSRDLCVGGHPVVWVRYPLFCSQEWQYGTWHELLGPNLNQSLRICT